MERKPYQRVVFKFGTGILTRESDYALDSRQITRLAGEVADVARSGRTALVVSSGAVGAGLSAMGLTERPRDLPTIQACAALGQPRLMRCYEEAFSEKGFHVAQLLLTHEDIDSRLRNRNARNTLSRLLSAGGLIPVINENDSVAVDELRFGDNDTLSAEVAILAEADLLVILSGVEGLTRSPDGSGAAIPVVADIDEVAPYAGEVPGKLSVGGMASKLKAVRLAVDAGIPAVIANGRTPGIISQILADEKVGTRFLTAVERRALTQNETRAHGT